MTKTTTKTAAKIKMSEILKGCEPHRIQSVGYMQVIPLTMAKELWDERLVSSADGKVGTSGYGRMVVDNTSEKEMIVPAGAGYVVKQAAQDHALPHVGLIAKNKSKTFETAMCIQQSQGGYIQKDTHPMLILPFVLREQAHKMRKEQGFQRLWPAIKSMNAQLGVRSDTGHLEFFLTQFSSELDKFVAEFEIVPDQVGGIILINGRLVGVERAPNPEFWASVWQPLIRECYGSLAIIEERATGKSAPPQTRVSMRQATSLDDISVALKEAGSQEWEKVKSLVEDVMSEELGSEKESSEDGFQVDTVNSERFVGQIVRDGEKVVYASVIATAEHRKNEIWRGQKEFSMKPAGKK